MIKKEKNKKVKTTSKKQTRHILKSKKIKKPKKTEKKIAKKISTKLKLKKNLKTKKIKSPLPKRKTEIKNINEPIESAQVVEKPIETLKENSENEIYISPYLINLKEIAQAKQKNENETKEYQQPPRKHKIPKINFLKKNKHSPNHKITKTLIFELSIFTVICLILGSIFFSINFFQTFKTDLLATRGKVLGEASVAIDHLLAGSKDLMEYNPGQANYQFSKANDYFNQASAEIEGINKIIKETVKIIPYDKGALESADSLIGAGKNITEVASCLTKVLTIINKENEDFGYENREMVVINNDAITTDHLQTNFYHKLEDINLNIALAYQNLANANNNLTKVNPDIIPADEKENFLAVKDKLSQIGQSFSKINNLTNAWLDILGKRELKRYLLIFQNNNELRATGGFMGSFALITLDKGLIKKIEFPEGGSYDIQGQLLERLKPPAALQLITSRWYFHDANWWPDFPTSAQKMIWFYEKSGGPTPDGVIAVTADIMKDLLEITGPIEMTKYNKTIAKDNYYEEIQRSVELEYDKIANRPKRFMVDLMLEMMQRFANSNKKFIDIFQILDKSFSNKTVQFYFTDEKIEKAFAEFNLTGQIKQLPGDYLAVINTNLRGGKTDNVIKKSFSLETTIDEQGKIINTLTLTRTHQGDPNNLFEKITNLDWLRIYVPKGSQLISATGFNAPDKKTYYPEDSTLGNDEDLQKLEGNITIDPASDTKIYNQFNKTVFANWVQTPVGQTSKIILKYSLPFTLNNRTNLNEKNYYELLLEKLFSKESATSQEDLRTYTLFIQKQAGDNNLTFSHEIILPNNWQNIWQNKEQITNIDLNQDTFYGAIYQVK